MYELWYDYVTPKHVEKTKLCYTDRNSLIVYEKTDDIHESITEDFKTRFDSLIY